jgi:Family of unknown function (DUF5994)
VVSLEYRPDSALPIDPPRVWLEPVSDHHMLLDGSWWPNSDDLGAELRALLPVLDRARGPVARVLLSAAGWTTRPHHVVLADRTVSIGYLADQPPSMMIVRWADGGTFIMRVGPSGPAPGVPEGKK